MFRSLLPQKKVVQFNPISTNPHKKLLILARTNFDSLPDHLIFTTSSNKYACLRSKGTWNILVIVFTCLKFCVSLLEIARELELSWWSSMESSSFLTDLSTEKDPRGFFLGGPFDLLPVKVVCGDTLGVQTTSEDSDLSFLLNGNVTEGTTSGAFTLLLFEGNIFHLTSCKLWSGLFEKNKDFFDNSIHH